MEDLPAGPLREKTIVRYEEEHLAGHEGAHCDSWEMEAGGSGVQGQP